MKVHRRKFSPVRLPALIAAALSLGGVGVVHGDLLITLSSANGGTATLATFFGTISGFGPAVSVQPGTSATGLLTNRTGGDRLDFANTSAPVGVDQDRYNRDIAGAGHQFANGSGSFALVPPPTATGANGFQLALDGFAGPTRLRVFLDTGSPAPTSVSFGSSETTIAIAFSSFNTGIYDWGVFGEDAGDAIRLVVIPEPGTAPVLGAALFAGLLVQRRRRR